MFYLGAACIFFITMGLMYGEARYAQGREDVVDELIKKYQNEIHGEQLAKITNPIMRGKVG